MLASVILAKKWVVSDWSFYIKHLKDGMQKMIITNLTPIAKVLENKLKNQN
jgi:hypothetical protein